MMALVKPRYIAKFNPQTGFYGVFDTFVQAFVFGLEGLPERRAEFHADKLNHHYAQAVGA